MRNWDQPRQPWRMPSDDYARPLGERVTAIERDVTHLSREVWQHGSLTVEQQQAIGRIKSRLLDMDRQITANASMAARLQAIEKRVELIEQAGATLRWLRENWLITAKLALALTAVLLLATGKATKDDLLAVKQMLGGG